MAKILPRDLTSYDFLKTAAVLLMIIDHIGYHFFPDEMWFRVFGRLCVPMWFFLIGYARSTDISWKLYAGGGILVLSSVLAGQYLFPLDILLTIALARYLRQGVVDRALHSPEALRGMFLILLFSTFISQLFFAYGTMSMLFVLFGYIMRNYEAVVTQVAPKFIVLYVVAGLSAFFISEGVGFPFIDVEQALVMMAGFVLVGWWLWNFEGKTYPLLTAKLPYVLVVPIKFMGRRTLEIYVLHLLLFRGLGMYLYPDRFGFMEWKLIPEGLLHIFVS